MSAAFDIIDHENLFNHLDKYVGISGNALKLIKSYISGRTQRVMINGILSDVASLICGVPQGSVLGLLKFCLYLLPLAAILSYHNIGYHVYTDDTQLYILFKNKDPSGLLARLNSCISDIRVWMIKNNLKINDSKTEFIILRSPQCKASISGVSVSVGDSNILPSPKVRDLGVIFDECLTLDAHISNICRRAHFHLRNIGRIRMLLSFEPLSQLIHALITTTLDYCKGILFNLPKNKMKRLQRIQNQAARMLKRIPRRHHITPVLKDLHLLRINDRIDFKILILTHRAFYKTGPIYLSELIKKHNSSNRAKRANDHCLLSIPPISKMCAIVILNDHLVMFHLFFVESIRHEH